jgi:hypothetical protein
LIGSRVRVQSRSSLANQQLAPVSGELSLCSALAVIVLSISTTKTAGNLVKAHMIHNRGKWDSITINLNEFLMWRQRYRNYCRVNCCIDTTSSAF